MKRIYLLLIMPILLCTANNVVTATVVPDEEDYGESIRMPIRRLHPERPTASEQRRMRNEEKKLRDSRKKAEKQQARQVNNTNVTVQTTGETKDDVTTVTSDKAWLNELLSKDYSIVEYDIPDNSPKPMVWKDEAITDTESALLNDVNRNGSRYMPRATSMDQTENEIFFYFTMGIDRPEPLRMRVQYYADDPLHYSKIVFLIDGFEYEYTPSKTNRGTSGSRMYWENSDEALKSSDKDLIYALTHCSWARAKIVGERGVSHVRMLTEKQLANMATMLKLYLLYGGTL